MEEKEKRLQEEGTPTSPKDSKKELLDENWTFGEDESKKDPEANEDKEITFTFLPVTDIKESEASQEKEKSETNQTEKEAITETGKREEIPDVGHQLTEETKEKEEKPSNEKGEEAETIEKNETKVVVEASSSSLSEENTQIEKKPGVHEAVPKQELPKTDQKESSIEDNRPTEKAVSATTATSPPPTTQKSSENEKLQEERLLKRRRKFVFTLTAIVLLLGSIGVMAYDWTGVSSDSFIGQTDKIILELDGKKYEIDLKTVGYDGKDPKTINETQLRQWLNKVKKEVDIPVVNANAEKLDGPISPERPGRYMDTEQVNQWLKDIPSLINKPRKIPVIPAQPTITTEDIKNVKQKLVGSYTTSFDPNNTNRNTNIRLASNAISGIILMPGEEFSFNKVVGKRTKERGYKEAGVIVKGEFSEGIGGGICQVSSTLFNSVDEAGLKITRRQSHSAEVNYVPKGRDATVSWGGPDFRFKNNLNKPVLIIIEMGTSKLTVKTYTTSSAKVQKRKVEPPPKDFIQIQVDPEKPTEQLSPNDKVDN